MTSPDISIARMMLADAPGLSAHPGLVAALVSGRATSFQTRAVGQFVDQLELAKKVELARASGAALPLSPSDKALLDTLGQPYDDVDQGRLVTHAPEPAGQKAGFWGLVGAGFGAVTRTFVGGNAVVNNPVTRGVLHGLSRAADVATEPGRLLAAGGLLRAAGVDTPLNTPVIPGLAAEQDRVAAENAAAMARQGYTSSDFFDVLAWYSKGERVFADLDPLRAQYGAEQVTMAARYLQATKAGDEDWLAQLGAGKDPATIAAMMAQLNDPAFQVVVQAVDAAHLSAGRDLARGVGIDPVAHPGVFRVVSGAADAAVAWYADPTLVLGKGYAAYRGAQVGLRSALDGEGVRRVLDPANRNVLARQVQRGFQALLDDTAVIRTGQPEEAAAAFARVNGRTPDLVPLLGDITGESRVLKRSADAGWTVTKGAPITTMDELTAHLVDTNALLRLSKGLAAAETVLMPGAVSRYGYRAMKGAAAGKVTQRGLARKGWVDVRDDPARLIPTPGDAVGSTVADDVADHLTAGAAARGEALLNERRYGRYVAPSSRAGRSLAFFSPGAIGARLRYSGQRLTNLLPTGTRLDWADPASTEWIRRYALAYMPKSEANLLAAQYAGADEAGRMAVARAVAVQTAHAAGLPASVSGRQLVDRLLADLDSRGRQVYSPVAGADMYVNPNSGETVHAALWDGQLDTGLDLPSFAAMQQHAAKASIWDHTVRSALSSGWADDVMGTLKPLWLLTGSNVARNVLEDWAGAGVRGQGRQVVKARSAVATRRVLTGAFDNPDEARSAVGRAAGRVGDAVIVKHLRGLKASAHLAVTDSDYLRALEDIGTPEVDRWMGRLAGDAHKAILSPGEADVVDEITAAGYQVRDLRVKLEPGGYDLIPADGGKGARAWSANLASRVTGSGIGEHAVATLLDPSISREVAVARHADYLASDAAKEFRDRAQRAAHTKAGVPVADDAVLRSTALQELARDQLDDMEALLVDRDGNLVEPLAGYLTAYGRAPSAEWLAANIPDALRPEHAVGKTWVAVSGQTTTAGVMSAIRSASRTGYQHLVERPIEALSRQPVYLVNMVRARRNLTGYADRLVEQGMTLDAAKALERSTVAEQAFHATVRQVDNPDARTQMDVVARNFFTFSRATSDFLRRWGRTFREDPGRLQKAQLAIEGGIHSGFVTKDDQGSMQFTYPGSGAAINALLRVGQALHLPGIVALPVQPNLSTKLIYLNAGLDNPIGYTVSPLVSTPVSMLGGLLPGHELGQADLDLLMRGQLGAGRPAWESFMPTALRRFWAALDDDDRNSQTASAVRNAIIHMDAAGLTPPADATPGQRDTFLQRLRTGAHNQLFARAIFATFAPGAPSQPEQATGQDAADPFYRAQGISSLQDEFRAMVSDYGYSKALAVWTQLHPDKLAFTVSGSQTAGKSQTVPATRTAEQWMQEHRDLLAQYKTVAGYLVPTDPGEFSQQAWQAQLESGLRVRKDIGDFYSDVRVRGAERTYYTALDARDAAVADALAAGDDEKARGIKEGFRLWSEMFQSFNPLFAEKQASYQTRVVQAQQGLAELRRMLDDPTVPGLPELPGVRALVDAYAAHTQWAVQLKGQRSAEATAARDGEQAAFGQYMTGLVGQYPGLRDLYNGLFRPLDTDLEYAPG